MNKSTFKLAVLFCLFSIACIGQKCKYSKKVLKRAKKHISKEVIRSTKPRAMFSKFSQAASTSFIRSSDEYYLGLVLVREFGARVDIMEDNPLIFQFKNDSIIALYPDKSTPGKFSLPVTTEVNKPYYKVNQEQLDLFASQPIVHIKVYFTSDKVADGKRGVDDLGTFFDFEILNDRYQTNCIESANCILQE